MVENTLEKTMIFIYVMTPIAGLAVNVLIQILSFRAVPKIGLLKSIYCGFFAGLCFMAVIDITYLKFFSSMFRSMTFPNITNMIIYAASGYCYFHFVCLGETARRIRMMAEIYDSKEGLSMEEILSRYDAAEIVESRINRLLKNGQLRYKDGRYFIGKPIVLLIALTAIFLKVLFLGRKSEFDKKAA